MAVTLTVNDLAVAVRVATSPSTIPPEYLDILTRALQAATDAVELYAGPDTPQQTENEAARIMAAYLIDTPAPSRNPMSAFRHSGALGLLAPWHVVESATV